MTYRTLEIAYKPRSAPQWATYSAARREAARLWNHLVQLHFRIRRRNLTWPSKARLQQWAKGRFPGLSAQSVQQTIAEFCEAVHSARQLRKNGVGEARYPCHPCRYRDVTYTNQDARIRHRFLLLPNGHSGTLRVRLPEGVELPGKLMEVRLGLFCVTLVCQVPDLVRDGGPIIGVDLGVNTLIAATDGDTAVLVSGRQVKSMVQGRNKALAEISKAQSRKLKGSVRWKRLQRKKMRMLAKAKRRIRDACHKATRQIANAFPNAKCFVGKPFNAAAMRLGRVQAQTVSQACNGKIIALLGYKTAGALEIEEHYTSQTCPVCGDRKKCKRTYGCSCGVTAPRDVVGSVNIRSKGIFGAIATEQRMPG